MKKLWKLTLEEREFATENHRIAEQYLRNHRLPWDDFYDVIIFGYLSAVQEYLSNPHLQQYTFRCIANRKMHDALVEEYRYRGRQKRAATAISYQEESALRELDRFLPQRAHAIEERLHDQDILSSLLSCLTPKEREVVRLRADGYTDREIAEQCQISVYGVQSRVSRFRKRLLKIHIIPQGGSAA